MRCRPAAGVLAFLVVAATGCGDDDAAPTGTTEPTTTSTTTSADDGVTTTDTTGTETPQPLDRIEIALEPVGDFDEPTAYRAHPDGDGYVAERAGRVRSFRSGEIALDISDMVSLGSEQGFLGIAFSSGGDLLYVDYTDLSGTTVVAEYPFADGRADPGGRREILRVPQPFANHNAGDIHFGPDGHLYVTLGDGGGAGDPGNNGQDPSTLLGSILRIDPSSPSGGRPYGIPADNPFADGGGRPEIYLYGVRNPWRISFDSETTDLWVADVGQNAWEEVNHLPAEDGRGVGANLGWNLFEGTHPFRTPDPDPQGLTFPVHEYPNDDGNCAITGGFVYRGEAIRGLDGAYFFADVCQTDLRALRVEGGSVTEHRSYPLGVGRVISFGVDPDGELLVLSQEGTIHRIVPA